MAHKTLKQEVWRLILIPSLAITLLLSATLSYLYISQLNKFVSHRGSMLTLKTAQLSQYALSQNDRNMVQSILNASLEEPFVRAVSLHTLADDKTWHAGPVFFPLTEEAKTDWQEPHEQNTAKSIRFSSPVIDDNDAMIGRLELELLTSPFLVIRYETLLITILVTLLCLILAAVLAVRLHEKITQPLGHIRNVVQKLAAGKLHTRVDTQQSREFTELAAAVNNVGSSMEVTRDDMQLHMDQYTEDLRETLETIEIQNIELDIARKQALEASRIKSEFLANTSHEIRTPLNGILGFTNLTLKTELDEQQRDYLNTIRDSAQNLLTIINDILDFSKIEAGKLTLDYAPLQLRRVVEETLHILAPDAHEKHIQLINYIDQEIPACLLGDPLRFKQILSNLTSNAIKFSPKGNIVINIGLVSKTESQVVIRVEVRDQGIGLSNQQKEGLFKAFAQVDNSSSREHGGTGLGLAICKGLVERMGGEIDVDSEPEKGSVFWFTAKLGIDKRQPIHAAFNVQEQNILVCGENPQVNAQITGMLHRWQAHCHSITTIHDIFPVLRQAHNTPQAFSLVILDIAPEDRKIKPIFLQNLIEQFEVEFGCDVIVCCTTTHQRQFKNQADNPRLTVINKPVTVDSLQQAVSRQLNIQMREARPLDNNTDAIPFRSAISVLIVDDNAANLQLAAELLRGLNTKVVTASSGKQALELCELGKFDIIFMDIQMPGMDGLETTRRIRETESDKERTPIIALTAHSMTEQKSELLIAGMDDCVSKPVSENQLAHIISRWTNMSGKKDTGPLASSNRAVPPLLPAVTQAPDDLATVDIALGLQLANFKPALARDMLKMLLENLPSELADINKAFRDNDFLHLEERVHRMYGSSCYCGVPRLKKISSLLDKLLQAKQYNQTEEVIASLNLIIEDILLWAKGKDIDALFGLSPNK